MITQYGHRYFNDIDGDVWDDEPEPEPTYICDNCGRGIYEGAEFYDIGGLCYCRACVQHKCADILRCFGGEDHAVKHIPTCKSCGEEIRGKYITIRGKHYCEDCYTDLGEKIVEDVFGIKSETAGEPEDWRED